MVPCYSRYCPCRLYTPRNTSLRGSTSVASIAAGSSASWGHIWSPITLAIVVVGFTPHATPACTAAPVWQALLQMAVLAGGTYGPLLLSLLFL